MNRIIPLPLLIVVMLAQFACGDRSANIATDSAGHKPQSAGQEKNGIRWFEGTVEAAFVAAKEQQKPVFLYWGEEWCPFCNRLEETVFVRDEFINLSHEFIALKLGTDSGNKVQYGERFSIRGFPTVIVFNPDGQALTRIDGGTNTEQYARVLETTLGEVRPVGELVRSVQAGEQLTPGEWTLLENYPWRHEADLVLADDADLHAVFQVLSDRVPDELGSTKSRLKMQELSAWLSDEDRETSLAPAYREFLQAVLADDEMARENLESIASDANEIIELAIPADQQDAFRDRILDEVQLALKDPETGALERIGMLMGWLSVSTAASDGAETLPEPEMAWVKHQAEAAREELSPDQLQSGLVSLYEIYSRMGMNDDARDVLRQGIEQAQAPYYFMTILASLEKKQGKVDEALEWYGKAWDASRGPINRARWGSTYLSRLLELSPDNFAAIGETGLQILAEITDQDDWQKNYERTLSRLGDQLLDWSGAAASEERQSVLNDVRSKMQDYCRKASRRKEDIETCESLLMPA